MAFVGSAHEPGPVPVRRRLSRVHRPRRTGPAETGRQGRSAGLVRPAAQRGHGHARLDGQALRATVAGKAMKEGKDDQRPPGRGMRRDQRRAASAPACRRHAWLEETRARSAPSARCAGRSGAACSENFRGAKCNAAGWAAGRPLESDTRVARTIKRNKKRAEVLDAYMSPFSAIDSTELPATIR